MPTLKHFLTNFFIMSIIISVLTGGNELFVGSDKKAKQIDAVHTENFESIIKLRSELYFGMAGSVNFGNFIKNELINHPNFGNLSVQAIVKRAENVFKLNYELCPPAGLSIMLAGRFENKDAFICGMSNLEDYYLDRYSQSTDPDSKYSHVLSATRTHIYLRFLENQMKKLDYSIEDSIIKTIEIGSVVDVTISNKYYILKI